MFDNKFIITLFSLIFAVYMICNNKNNIKENFVNDATFKVVTECSVVEDSNVSDALNANIFKVPGHFQKVSRQNVQSLGGAHLNEHKKFNKYMGVTEQNHQKQHNLMNNHMLQDVVKEDYNHSSCGSQVHKRQENYPNPSSSIDESIIELPPNDMTLPKEKTVKCVSRLMFANKKSRTRAQGCPIRGDLAIPMNKSKCGWFQVSANPTIDLHQGGIYSISGHHDKDMAILMKKGGKTASGGGDIQNYNIQGLGVPIDTIQVENFP